MVAVPVKVLVCLCMFSVNCSVVRRVFSGPGETNVSNNGMDPSVLAVSAVN